MKIAFCLLCLFVSALAHASPRADFAPAPRSQTAVELVSVLIENGSAHADRDSLLILQYYLESQVPDANLSPQQAIEQALQAMKPSVSAPELAAALIKEALTQQSHSREARSKVCCGSG